MDDETGMKVLESFCHLVDDESDVYVFEDIFRYDIVKVGFHELEDQINVLVVVGP